MQKFYDNYESIHRLTLALDYHQNDLECAHCLKCDQFVSHGIIYKQLSIAETEKVGKRIFCSNRYGRSGCGRTFQLYVASKIPYLRYGASHLFIFIASLLANLSISEAYQKATGQFETRHAWRWLNKLMLKLTDYRSHLKVRRTGQLSQPTFHSSRLQHLLPTLNHLSEAVDCPCLSFQLRRQTAFI